MHLGGNACMHGVIISSNYEDLLCYETWQIVHTLSACVQWLGNRLIECMYILHHVFTVLVMNRSPITNKKVITSVATTACDGIMYAVNNKLLCLWWKFKLYSKLYS